jgi:prepilin-type N-terminal cleavage/methylation domain-containing protein
MSRTGADGFTLIEILIVVGLIAVLAGATVPTLTDAIQRYSLMTASQPVVSTIRGARHQAVGQNRTLRVRFDFPAAGQYQVLDATDAAVGDVQFLPEGALFGAVSGDIQISTSGRVTDMAATATTETIVVSNDDGQTRTITVSASGRVQLP